MPLTWCRLLSASSSGRSAVCSRLTSFHGSARKFFSSSNSPLDSPTRLSTSRGPNNLSRPINIFCLWLKIFIATKPYFGATPPISLILPAQSAGIWNFRTKKTVLLASDSSSATRRLQTVCRKCTGNVHV